MKLEDRKFGTITIESYLLHKQEKYAYEDNIVDFSNQISAVETIRNNNI